MLYRLSDLKRYNNQPRIKSESLAEHQFYCSLILLLLERYLNIDNEDMLKLLKYSLIHDIGELYTGDVPHNFKKRFPQMKVFLDEAEFEFMSEYNFEGIITDIVESQLLKNIFKLADTIQVLQYVKNEINNLGNSSNEMKAIRQIATDECMSYITMLQHSGTLSLSFNLLNFVDEL